MKQITEDEFEKYSEFWRPQLPETKEITNPITLAVLELPVGGSILFNLDEWPNRSDLSETYKPHSNLNKVVKKRGKKIIIRRLTDDAEFEYMVTRMPDPE